MFYNVTFWHVRVTNHCCRGKAISINILCVCSLSYPACTAHEQRVLPSVASGCTTFSTLSHKRQDFREKNVTEHKMCVLSFSTTFVWSSSHSKKNRARYDKRRCIGLHVNYPLFESDIKLEFSRQIVGKDNKFHETSCSGSRVLPCGRKDGHEEANSRFSRFCERPLKTCLKTPPVKKHTFYSYNSFWRKTLT